MSEPEVIVAVEGEVGRLTLNRPAALHALTTTMVRLMTAALLDWRGDKAISTVLIDHSGERGFCAGGDIRFLAESAAEGGAGAREFFFEEYRLNHLLFTYPKTVVAIMDGITMGGGVGISLPADYRIGTERTTFAMPETGIGLFPDVGGGWHLPRLHGAAGAWLALTGARLKAADCELLGITTDIVQADTVPALKAELTARPGEIEEISHRTGMESRTGAHRRPPRRDRQAVSTGPASRRSSPPWRSRGAHGRPASSTSSRPSRRCR